MGARKTNILIALLVLASAIWIYGDWPTYTPTAINPSPAAPGAVNEHYWRSDRRIARINGVTIALAPTTAGDYVYRSTNDSTWAQMGTLGAGIYKAAVMTGKDSTFYIYYYSGTTLRQRKWVYTVTSLPSATTILTHATLGTTGTGAYRCLSAAPDSIGRIYLCYHMGTYDSIMVIRSDDDGNTWNTPVKVYSLASQAMYNPHIDFGRDGDAYVGFVRWSTAFGYVSKSTNQGATWVADTVSATAIGNPSILIVGADTIYYFYQNTTNATSVRRSVDGGEIWGAAVNVSSTCGYGDPSAALGSDGTIYCAFRTDLNSGIIVGTCGAKSKFRLKQSTNQGATWTLCDSAVVGFERACTKNQLRYQTWHNYGGLLQWTWGNYTSTGTQRRTFYDMNRGVTIMQYGTTYTPPEPPAGEAPDSLWVRSDGTDSLRIISGNETGSIDSTVHYYKKGYGGTFTRLGKLTTWPDTLDVNLSLAAGDTLWNWYIPWYAGFQGDTTQGLWGADLATGVGATGGTMKFTATASDSVKRNIDSLCYVWKRSLTPPTTMTDTTGGNRAFRAFNRDTLSSKSITVAVADTYGVSIFSKRWRKGGDAAWYKGGGDTARVKVAAAGSDSVFAWHCESTGDITTTTPAGYSAGDKTPAINSGAVIAPTIYQDGDSSLSIPTASDRMAFTITSEDIASQDSGTIDFYMYMTNVATSNEYCVFFYNDADNVFKLRGHTSNADEATLYWEGNNAGAVTLSTTVANLADSTWYRTIVKWRTGVTNFALSLKIGDAAAVTTDTDLTLMAADPAELWFGQQAGTNIPHYIDNIKVFKSWKADR